MKGALAAVLVFLSMTTSASAQDDAYRRLAEEATSAMAEHQLDHALALFREMHAMSPSARTLYSLGRVHYEQTEYVAALDYLEQALRDARRPLEGTAIAEATSLRDRARALTAEVTVTSDPPDAAVLVDDVEMAARTFRLDPGEHTVRLERAGYTPGVRRIIVRGGEAPSVSLVLTPIVASAGDPTLGPAAALPHEVTLDVVSEQAGLTLHLQPLAVSGTGGTVGPLELVCEAPCTRTVRAGTYGGGVSRSGGDPHLALGALLLEADSTVQLQVIDNSGFRIGMGTSVGLALVYGVLATTFGALITGRDPAFDYDSTLATGLLASGVTIGTVGLLMLGLVFVDDEVAIRAAPR